jgi:hypothetical protein
VEERNDFLLEDLHFSVGEVSDIWPELEFQLLRLAFFTADQNRKYLDLLTAGVPWFACWGALIYGWSPGDAVTAVCLTGVPATLPDAAIRAHFGQFGCVTRVFRSKDKVFTKATNGIAHISIAVAPGFTLPAFVLLVHTNGCADKRMLVHSDASCLRCSRCGTRGQSAQFCRAGHRATGADATLWSVVRIPIALLPVAVSALDCMLAQRPSKAAACPPATDAVSNAASEPQQPAGLHSLLGCLR